MLQIFLYILHYLKNILSKITYINKCSWDKQYLLWNRVSSSQLLFPHQNVNKHNSHSTAKFQRVSSDSQESKQSSWKEYPEASNQNIISSEVTQMAQSWEVPLTKCLEMDPSGKPYLHAPFTETGLPILASNKS